MAATTPVTGVPEQRLEEGGCCSTRGSCSSSCCSSTCSRCSCSLDVSWRAICCGPTSRQVVGAKAMPQQQPDRSCMWVCCRSRAAADQAAQTQPQVPFARQNSFHGPMSWQQVVMFTVVFGDLLIAPCLAFLLEDQWLRFEFLIAFGACFFTVMTAGIWTCSVDPSEAQKVKAAKLLPADRDMPKMFCRHCQLIVSGSSKHCWDCGKCVAGFDHHCPWLNTCIGERNYRPFYVACMAHLIQLSLMVALPACLLAGYISEDGAAFLSFDEDRLQGLVRVAVVACLVVHFPLWMLNFSLVSFHSYLCVVGISTYEYIKRRRAVKQAKLEAQIKAALPVSAGGTALPTAPLGTTSAAAPLRGEVLKLSTLWKSLSTAARDASSCLWRQKGSRASSSSPAAVAPQ